MSDPLPEFDGSEVTRSAVRITKAGDGLSEALKILPEAFHGGDEVYFVLRGRVSQVNHKFLDDDDGTVVRVHTIDTVGISTVDSNTANRILNKAAEVLAQARADADNAEQQRMLDMEAAAEAGGD